MEADGDGGSGGTRVWSVLFPRTTQGTPGARVSAKGLKADGDVTTRQEAPSIASSRRGRASKKEIKIKIAPSKKMKMKIFVCGVSKTTCDLDLTCARSDKDGLI